MFYILVVFISAVTFLLQVSILPQVAIFNVALNITVLATIFWLIYIDQNFAITFSLILGFLLDIFSASIFGAFAVSLALVILVLKRIIDLYFQKESIVSTIFLQVVGIILFNIFFALMNVAAQTLGLDRATFDLRSFLTYIIPLSALWAGVASMVLLRFYRKLSGVVQYFQARTKA